MVALFEPSQGVIQPKSELKIKMTVTVYTGGNLNELFLCDINDMELPIGFEMLADAYGLTVSYETKQDEPNASQLDKSNASGMTKKSGDGQSQGTALQMLTFPSCTINKVSSQKFVLKNLSGIKTSFLFDVKSYAPTS